MKPVIQVFSVFSIPMWKKKTFFIKNFSIPLFVRHEFSSMTIQHRCPWLDMHQVTKHARAQLERMLSVFFFLVGDSSSVHKQLLEMQYGHSMVLSLPIYAISSSQLCETLLLPSTHFWRIDQVGLSQWRQTASPDCSTKVLFRQIQS